MRILITNDDGIDSLGIRELVKAFEADHEIVVVAPDTQRSAAGHSITIHRPIIIREQRLDGFNCKAYSTDGTPADCVKLGVDKICGGRESIDLVISGINHGTNLGSDVIYSGTVSAAIEGSICGVPSFAISLDIRNRAYDYKVAAEYARRIVLHAMRQNVDSKTILNINVPGLPADGIKGVRVSGLGTRVYQNAYLETKLENSETGYRIKGFPRDEQVQGTDTYDILQGYVTVTPLHYDLTSYKLFNMVNEWFKGEI